MTKQEIQEALEQVNVAISGANMDIMRTDDRDYVAIFQKKLDTYKTIRKVLEEKLNPWREDMENAYTDVPVMVWDNIDGIVIAVNYIKDTDRWYYSSSHQETDGLPLPFVPKKWMPLPSIPERSE